ncbi:MAG: hypothetical protein ACAH12_03480 [Methylophilaceae bacterium]
MNIGAGLKREKLLKAVQEMPDRILEQADFISVEHSVDGVKVRFNPALEMLTSDIYKEIKRLNTDGVVIRF